MAFQRLVSTDTAVMAGVALGGYMAPFLVNNLTNQVGFDTPNELDGLVVFTLVAAMPETVPMPRAAEAGALAYAGEAAAERFGIKSTIAGVGS